MRSNRRPMVVPALGLVLGAPATTAGCREPGIAFVDIPKAAESARAAAAAAASASAGPAPEPSPVLVEEVFKAEAPSSHCAPSTSGYCALDNVAGVGAADVTTVKREGTTTLFGWAADVARASVPPVVVVEIAGSNKKFYAAATRATKRPDVVDAFKQPALLHSGYDVLASFRGVDPGEYRVQIVQVTAAGSGLTCDTGRKLRVE